MESYQEDIYGGFYLGAFNLNLIEASFLVAKCLWFDGVIHAEVPEKDAYSLYDKDLDIALVEEAKKYEGILIEAIKLKELETIHTDLDLYRNINPRNTYIDAYKMSDWFDVHGITFGELFHEDYLMQEIDIQEKVSLIIKVERLEARNPSYIKKYNDTKKDLARENILLQEENSQLKAKFGVFEDGAVSRKPISEKQRGAYINIIGALLLSMLGKSSGG